MGGHVQKNISEAVVLTSEIVLATAAVVGPRAAMVSTNAAVVYVWLSVVLRCVFRVFLHEAEVEGESASWALCGADGASVEGYGVFDDGESESGSAEFAASAFVDAVESLEDAWHVFWWDASPVVGKGEVPVLCVVVCGYFDGGACSSIFDGVVCEVSEDAVYEHGVSFDVYALWQAVAQCHFLLAERLCCFEGYVGYHGGDVNGLECQHVGCIVYAVEHGNVLQQGGEALGLCVGALYEFLLGFVVDVGGVEYGFGVSQDAGYGCFEFVGDVLCEFAAHLVFFFYLFAADAFVHFLCVAMKEVS